MLPFCCTELNIYMKQIHFISNISSSYFKIIFSSIIIVFLASTSVTAQKEFDDNRGTQHWMKFSDAANSLYHYLAAQAYSYLDKRSDKIASLSTLAQWQERQKWIAATLKEAVGPFPAKTPLNAKLTKSFDKEGYRIEDIIYESQPGYYVTSTLFIPKGLKKGTKFPAIIYCSGHSDDGYRSIIYQHEILNLVKKGFVVFAFDPMGQGERLQYYDPKTGKSRFRWPSYEHSYPGAQLFITGNSLAQNFIWDGIRAIDYLLTRKEVDAGRIGITGGSGGGTQSAYIAAFDERIKATAPRNYFTNFTRIYDSMGPQDAEQNFFYGVKRGIDMADLLLVRAPKPALMVTTTRDMFPIQGAIETLKEVAELYRVYGKPENIAMVTDDAPHASTKKNREAFYAFFQKFLDNPGNSSDEETDSLSEELKVTPTGQLATSFKGETAFSLNRKDAERRMEKLRSVRKDFPGYLSGMLDSAKKLSGYREPKEVHEPIFAGRIQREGYVIEKYLVKGEGDYMIPYLLLKPEKSSHKALLYLNPAGKSADSAEGGQMEWFARNGITVLAPDMVGTGELGPGIFQGDSYIDGVAYNLWFASMLIGRSIVGIQAGDVVRLADLLKKDNNIHEIYGLARTQMSPVLLHAAAFDKDIRKVALLEPYTSYRSIVMNRDYDAHFLHSTVPGAIGIYDLPDLAASLAPRKLLIEGATDENGKNDGQQEMNEDMKVIADAYQLKGKAQLQIVRAEKDEELAARFKSWISNQAE